MNGWIIINKDENMTSAQVVGHIKRLLNTKAGHAGTLDPIATGILPIALGKATKLIEYMMNFDKSYRFELTWGSQTDTLDKEGKVTDTTNVIPTRETIESVLHKFIGEQVKQIPPKYSALKINGKKAYNLAREGIEFDICARYVKITELKIVYHSDNKTVLDMSCGKGTYVRSVARDIAQEVGSMCYVSTLERTSVGFFTKNNAISLNDLKKIVHNGNYCDLIMPMHLVLGNVVRLDLTYDLFLKVKHGAAFRFDDLVKNMLRDSDFNVGLFYQDNLQALARYCYDDGLVKPLKVFC